MRLRRRHLLAMQHMYILKLEIVANVVCHVLLERWPHFAWTSSICHQNDCCIARTSTWYAELCLSRAFQPKQFSVQFVGALFRLRKLTNRVVKPGIFSSIAYCWVISQSYSGLLNSFTSMQKVLHMYEDILTQGSSSAGFSLQMWWRRL